MLTRDAIRDTASTLAHHWVGPDRIKDRLGVQRIILSHHESLRPVLCAHVMRYLEQRGWFTQAAAFEGLLFDLAGVEDDGSSDLPIGVRYARADDDDIEFNRRCAEVSD